VRSLIERSHRKSCTSDGKLSVPCPHLRRLGAQHSSSVAHGFASRYPRSGFATRISLRCLCSRCSQASARHVQRNHAFWHHGFPYLVAAVAVMWCLPGGHRWFRPAWTVDCSACLLVPHTGGRDGLSKIAWARKSARLSQPGLMSHALRLGRRVADALSPRGAVTHPDVCSTNQSVFRSVPRLSCSIRLIC
jgi:hypothetical protein